MNIDLWLQRKRGSHRPIRSNTPRKIAWPGLVRYSVFGVRYSKLCSGKNSEYRTLNNKYHSEPDAYDQSGGQTHRKSPRKTVHGRLSVTNIFWPSLFAWNQKENLILR